MSDEIKRAAENVLANLNPYQCEKHDYAGDCPVCWKKVILSALLAERRKAYEECDRIAKEYKTPITGMITNVGEQIANEIRRRMEG